ncbi:MAG: S41 family peptidase [Limnochordia bacterium]
MVLVLVGVILAGILIYQVQARDEGLEELELAMRIISLVKTAYVDEVSTVDLIKAYVRTGSVNGMLWDVLDPYTAYLDERAYKEMQMDTTGEFAGIGIVVTMHKGEITVVSPIQATPGYRAGLRTGDIIRGINGKPTEPMSLNEAVDMMRGPEGTRVVLQILRDAEVFDVEIVRANVEVPVIPQAELIDQQIGYLKLASFNEKTSRELARTLDRLEEEGMQALIIDLRGNPGGLLTTAVEVVDQFLAHGPIVHIVGRGDQRDTIYAQPRQTRASLPMVVLVDEGSASASEIVAGALRDSGLASLVGSKTFGKGLVQTVIPMGDGSALKLTTARYATSGGHFIDETGLEPDVWVELPEEGERELRPLVAELDLEADDQLRVAVELLQEKLAATFQLAG